MTFRGPNFLAEHDSPPPGCPGEVPAEFAKRIRSSKAKILVVDDHPVVREGIAAIVERQWEVCGQAGSGREAIEKAQDLQPDLILLDLSMPTMNGTETAREIHRVSPRSKVVFLSMHDSETAVKLGTLVGAYAFLTKTCSPDQLRKTIADVLKSPHEHC